ncbi:Methyltransferase type 11 [Kribbella flavida DSM 17836]|uniref:Methyltransferase type 11 n=1 Tax=Kribbella flavida (strain DSM 17836 / JCM 10339 / NBRC 14399) TaxID=479435 RepID=D2PT43_KRIFD|nr:class I SAM-dependent methyltransferase [Kribbella flavida]ADB29359.1 Methyltransferase type 11 [Kribbella flavida DSM 17836]
MSSRFALALEGRKQIESWAAGAQVLSLLSTIQELGWPRFLAEPRELAELAQYSGLPPARLADVLAVLEEYGIAELEGTTVRLSPQYEALAADDAWIGLGELLDRSEVMTRLVRTSVEDPGPLPLSEDDALVIARASGGRATDETRALFEQVFLPQLPELAELVRTDRWLDVGCGVAGSTLTLGTLFPEMRSVAVELVPKVAAEAVRRAEAHGVADRVDIRCQDIRELQEVEQFGGAFWAQPFFPEATRAEALAVIRRALKPAGLLLMQETDPQPQPSSRPAYAVRRLVNRGWGVPFGRTAEQLAVEGQAAGFELVRVAVTDFGRYVVLRRS